MNYEQEILNLHQKIDQLTMLYQNHRHTGLDSFNLNIPTQPSDLGLPNNLVNAPKPAITAPSGGATIDSQARTAINTIIADLTSLGLTL